MAALSKKGVKCVFVGQGSESVEKALAQAALKFSKNIYARVGFDAVLAQRVYAGADLFFMPSRFEPCGLGQMIAMRYGTIPIVRKVGGLNDTVQEVVRRGNKINGTGFLFENYSKQSFMRTVRRALSFYSEPRIWRNIVRNAMAQDFSWKQSAKKYFLIYKFLLKERYDVSSK